MGMLRSVSGGRGAERGSMLGLRLVMTAVALGGCIGAVAIGPSGPQVEFAQNDPTPTREVSPLRFKPGRVLSVSGTNCILGGRPMEESFVLLSRNVDQSGGEPFSSSSRHPVGPDGTWSGQHGVPVSAQPGAYLVTQSCSASDQSIFSPGNTDVEVSADPPAVATASAGTVVPGAMFSASVTVAGCVFEDGSPAASATATLLAPDGTAAGTATFAVGADGGGAGTVSASPDPPAYRVEVRCEGPLGALDAVAATVAVVRTGGIAAPVTIPLARTG